MCLEMLVQLLDKLGCASFGLFMLVALNSSLFHVLGCYTYGYYNGRNCRIYLPIFLFLKAAYTHYFEARHLFLSQCLSQTPAAVPRGEVQLLRSRQQSNSLLVASGTAKTAAHTLHIFLLFIVLAHFPLLKSRFMRSLCYLYAPSNL
jgi:hypothetical protein